MSRDRPPSAGEAHSGRAARLLIVAITALAAASALTTILLDPRGPNLVRVAALIAGMVGGEAFQFYLPYRRGGQARFTLSDTALTAGLLLAPSTEIVMAAAATMVGWQLVERVPRLKLWFNTCQYVAAAASAALVVQAVAPRPGPVTPATFAVVALGLAVFLLVNTVSVAGIIAATGGDPLKTTVGRLASTATVVAAGNACLGLVGVLLARSQPWALPALCAPLLALYTASRQEVGAKIARERSGAFVDTEQALSEAGHPDAVSEALVAGVRGILGWSAAIWREGRWATPVPDASSRCPLQAGLPHTVVSDGATFGPSVDGPVAAVGVGGGVLVAWSGELRLEADGLEWLERLGRSGRTSYARATASLALHNEQATLRAVVDGTGDGILVLDGDGVVRLCNPAMEQLGAMAADEAVGRPAAEVLGEGPWEREGVHDVSRDHDRVWRLSVDSVRDGRDGRSLRVLVVHDVSAERRVARMKDDMLAVVSHELRTPLTPIKASAKLLRSRWDRLAEDQRQELLDQIGRSTEHLARLVEDLLLVGRLSAGSGTAPAVDLAPVDLAALLTDVVRQLALARAAHEVTLTAPPSLMWVSDPPRLRQIVDNLVDNACKFSPSGSRVDVTLEERDGWAVLRVTDFGRGIHADDVKRIFERFERVEDPLHMTTSGAGLGLYIVRALVNALQGTIRVDSILGAGTTVTVALPLPGLPGCGTGADIPARQDGRAEPH
ncbi:MAG: PAS domain-containing sensor histidine kinase [Actinomycetota bacterium]|nr:PAS domain-containing sensor histidine kinase [Actinomycetota bacterium]